ncbi:esterase/lipase-like protein [Rhodopirellula maiorica SM1]|uniref:Esterase/lipase-like protein n=1 Tax=Rhodopirellula maiorica SM1 TaxID=1265738 RepID=M5RJX3_9BACT|nr:esterase/lipase-like protein [Rhodopirellula maiorica SM1]
MTVILGVLLLPVILIAQSDTDRFVMRMKQDDKNGDGKLTLAEFTGPKRLFEKLDDDGDGVLLLSENTAQKLREVRARAGTRSAPELENAERRIQMETTRSRAAGMRGGARQRPQPDHQNVRYGEHERHVLDVYLAETENNKPAPCMIWIHGGGFRRGDKSEGSMFSSFFTQNGIHYVTLNYRFSQHEIAPACFHDCARALQFLRRNAETWNIDTKRIAIGGGSAGAGLAQWLAYSPDRANPTAQDPVMRESTRVSALILLNAQTSYDFRWIKQHIPGDAWMGEGLQQLFGYTIEDVDELNDKQLRTIEECSPLTHFSGDDPPTLLFYRRSRDPQIAVQNPMDGIHHPLFGLELEERADKWGVPCEVFTVETPKDRIFYNNRWDYAVEFLEKHFQMK